jgi:hypothetical protein
MCYYNFFNSPLTRSVDAQLTTSREGSFSKGTGLHSSKPSCWQPHAHSWRWHLPLIEAAAHHLRPRTRHRHPASPPRLLRVTSPYTVARGRYPWPISQSQEADFPGSSSRPSSSIPMASRFSTPSWMIPIGPGRGGWSGQSNATETWQRRIWMGSKLSMRGCFERRGRQSAAATIDCTSNPFRSNSNVRTSAFAIFGCLEL